MVATAEEYPGRGLGLPATGHGSLASWTARFGGLVLDWAVCSLFALLLTRGGAAPEQWRAGLTLVLFLVESTVLSWLVGGSLGQLVCRIAVARLDRQHLGLARALLRAALVSLAIPALVIGPERRNLADLAAGTVVINRK